MEKYLEIGKIANTHGVKGELKVIPLTDDPERFKKLKSAFIDKNGTLEKVSFQEVKFFKNLLILKIKGLDDMTTAEALKGMYIKVDRENAVKLPKDSFFITDIIGCEVFDNTGVMLGILFDVLQTGSNDVYVVKRENMKDLLVPALKSVVLEVSVENRKIVVSLPEGLE